MDALLKNELGSIYTDVPGFDEAYFGGVESLRALLFSVGVNKMTTLHILTRLVGGIGPSLHEENKVLDWLITMVDKFRGIATEEAFTTKDSRRILGWPNQPLQGSTAAR